MIPKFFIELLGLRIRLANRYLIPTGVPKIQTAFLIPPATPIITSACVGSNIHIWKNMWGRIFNCDSIASIHH